MTNETQGTQKHPHNWEQSQLGTVAGKNLYAKHSSKTTIAFLIADVNASCLLLLPCWVSLL